MEHTTAELKKKIRKKYRNISRFSTLSQIPYHFIHNAFKKKHGEHLNRIARAIEITPDSTVFDELDPFAIHAVKEALKGKDLQEWCRDNGVNLWWLKEFLAGKIRFRTHHRVKRLFSLLKLE